MKREPRVARIRISREILHHILDLPEWMKVESARAYPDDDAEGSLSVIVSGPFLPEAPANAPLPVIEPIYQEVAVGKAKLQTIRGLDT